MRLLEPLPFSWRLSRYQPELRAAGGRPEGWTDFSDIGQRFNGLVLTSEEYLRLEDVYIAAAIRFAVDVSAAVFRVVYVGHQAAGFALAPGQPVGRSDLGPVVRGNLRGDLDCALESTDGSCQLGFGYDLYMYVAAARPCEHAVAESRRAGLWVEDGVPLALWEDLDD